MIDWLTAQLQAPGALAAFLQAGAVIALMLLLLSRTSRETARRRAAERREADAMAEIADHACDLVVAVADAMRDEVNAHEFAETFERRQLIDADLMLDAIPPHALPSLGLLRPLFELRWAVERSLELAEWLVDAVRDPDRDGWREAAEEIAGVAERAALAAESFRGFARSAGR